MKKKKKIDVETVDSEADVLDSFIERIQELYANNELKSVFILLQDFNKGCDVFSLGEFDLEDACDTLKDIKKSNPTISKILH